MTQRTSLNIWEMFTWKELMKISIYKVKLANHHKIRDQSWPVSMISTYTTVFLDNNTTQFSSSIHKTTTHVQKNTKWITMTTDWPIYPLNNLNSMMPQLTQTVWREKNPRWCGQRHPPCRAFNWSYKKRPVIKNAAGQPWSLNHEAAEQLELFPAPLCSVCRPLIFQQIYPLRNQD
jgi:hypothetical protein